MIGSDDWKIPEDVPCVTPVTSACRDVSIALFFLATILFALQVAIPNVVLLTVRLPISDTLKVSIYFAVSLAELGALAATAYYFSCRRTGQTIREGLWIVSVPPTAFCWSAVAAAFLIAFDLTITPRLEAKSENPVWAMAPPVGAIALSVLLLIQPPVYALFYQGFVYSRLRPLSEPFAFFMAIGAFAAHRWFGNGPVTQMISPALLTTVLTIQTFKSNSVIPAIVTLYFHRIAIIVLLFTNLMTDAQN